ncbi:MAG: Hsp20 family protein, partial [Shimia sp.]|nr:Hsp20 family protein [Shimia sp.]
REYGSFQRTFRLPPDADGEKIEADYADGLLKLKIAKIKSSKPEERKITIKTK